MELLDIQVIVKGQSFISRHNRQNSAGRCELNMKRPGQSDTIHFIRKDYEDTLPIDQIKHHVKSIRMNAKVSHSRWISSKQKYLLNM